MKVTPVSRKFGKYAPGDVFELKDKTAKLLIKVGKLREPDVQQEASAYQTRMMQAQTSPRQVSHEIAEALGGSLAPETVRPRESVPIAGKIVSGAIDSGALAPYGYKADGTPRLRPGRPAKSE